MKHLRETPSSSRTLRTVPLVGALYFMVAGGPYGLEEVIAGVGAKLAILVLIVTPIVWSLPTALMVGELGAALPEEGGYYAWVRRALGPFFGFQEAWLSLAASVFDMAIYPAIFVSYLAHFWPGIGEGHRALAVSAMVVVGTVLWNLRGSKAVGQSSVAMTILLLLPFAALAALALLHGKHASDGVPVAPTTTTTTSGVIYAVLLAMWNLMGWDNASTVASEVEKPQTAYPRAVMLAVLLVTLTYVIPTAAVAYAGVDVHDWHTGAWVDFGRDQEGAALAAALVVGGLLCGLGMQNALVLSYSRLPVALAEDGFLPPAFARRRPIEKGAAPVAAVLACGTAWLLMLGLKIDRLVSIDILLYGLSLLLEFVALAVLRVREPDLPRPYRVPGGTIGASLLGVPPVALLVLSAVKCSGDESILGLNALVFGALVALFGVPLYRLTRNRWPRVAS